MGESVSHSVMSDLLWPRGLQPARLLCPWESPGKHTGVGSHALLQGIFQPRDGTRVSCTAGRVPFTKWATGRDGYFLSGISFPLICSGHKNALMSTRTSPGLLVEFQVLWKLWRKWSSCSSSKHSSLETPGSASKPSLCPRLGIRNAPRYFSRGRDECALTQLLSRWSSVWTIMVICETESVHLIPSPPRTSEVPTSKKTPALPVSRRSVIFPQLRLNHNVNIFGQRSPATSINSGIAAFFVR